MHLPLANSRLVLDTDIFVSAGQGVRQERKPLVPARDSNQPDTDMFPPGPLPGGGGWGWGSLVHLRELSREAV